ncbi:hypothetical protein K6V78_09305 [Streptococcus gallolyticus]|nr:hypothetical protein [Streptococcus gallolyticus]MBY5041696.1 hypothetical protein [Streptococcus gallolyticus]
MPQTIDRTWKLGIGAPIGPLEILEILEILDIVGIQTAYNIMRNYAETSSDPENIHTRLAQMLKEDYLDKRYTGKAAGRGFYRY